jgi:hypothetical protein
MEGVNIYNKDITIYENIKFFDSTNNENLNWEELIKELSNE